MNLLDIHDNAVLRDNPPDWKPQPLPELRDISEIELDCETTGLRWWEKDRPIGLALGFWEGDRYHSQYIPWGHRGGGNLDEPTVLRWAQRELRGKRITNINTRFDVHMLREWGVDLEAQGCEVSDVSHHAALLDDHRLHNSLEAISQEFLHEGKKSEGIDKRRMAEYHAGQIAGYAEQDVRLVGRLRRIFWPMLDEQGLQKVRQLEDNVIYPVCEMEKNGCPIDLELLDRWVKESDQEFQRLIWKIQKATGLVITPTKQADKKKLWEKLGLKVPLNEDGNPTFKDEEIKHIKHPVVQMFRRAAKLQSLNSKYLRNYQKRVGSDGILRYSLHQLRAQKDDWSDSSEAGTISGRFSSTEITDGVGVNIQQIMKVAKQRVSFGYDEDDDSHDDEIYVIRRLHRPASGLWLSADAKQIEYRLFAHYAANPKVLAAYRENPDLHFHKFMWEMIRPYAKLTYRQQKDLNFAVIYAAGLVKKAVMLGFITPAMGIRLQRENAGRNHPLLQEARIIEQIYKREVPEADALIKRAAGLAKNRGYVKTLLGRRMRFPDGRRLHKGLNGVIQGGAADIMKQKLVELHANRKETGLLLRYTIHDEVDGDIPDAQAAKKVATLLDTQSFPELKVPILWDVSTGNNWAEAA